MKRSLKLLLVGGSLYVCRCIGPILVGQFHEHSPLGGISQFCMQVYWFILWGEVFMKCITTTDFRRHFTDLQRVKQTVDRHAILVKQADAILLH